MGSMSNSNQLGEEYENFTIKPLSSCKAVCVGYLGLITQGVITAASISEYTDACSSNVSCTLKGMVTKGYIVVTNPKERLGYKYKPTPKGYEVLAAMQAAIGEKIL